MAEQKRRKKYPFSVTLSAWILGTATAVFAVCALISGNGAEAAEHPVWQPLLKAHDRLSLMLGSNRLGSVYVTEDRLLPYLTEPEEGAVEGAAEAVNLYASTAGASVYMLAVPTSAGIYGDLLSDAAPLTNEHQILRTFSESLQEPVLWIEAASWLSGERDGYIYYRTDSNWTGYGAFCVYRSAIRKLGFNAYGYDHFNVKHFSGNYYGELAQRSHFYDLLPDTVDLYESAEQTQPPRVTALHEDGNTPLSGYFRTDLPEAKKNPEKVFAPETEPVLRIDTDNQSNKDLLLLTDRCGCSMIPFLMQHYRTITAVNLPECGETDWRRLTAGSYSQILILCGTETITAPDGLQSLLAPPEEDT